MLGAALAYYTLFAIAPLLLIAIAVVGLVFGNEAAAGQVFQYLRQWIGDTAAFSVEEIVRNASARPGTGWLAALTGGVTLLMGASSVFAQLQASMNQIWNVPPDSHSGISGFVKNRLLQLGFVLIIGCLLLFSITSTAVIAVAASRVEITPGLAVIVRIINAGISLGIITLLFALIFKFLPNVHIDWKDVWIGAFFTALLFMAGNFLVGLYLGKSAVGSIFGAAGSLIVLLVWVYYSAQILFFGAEFTQVYASRLGTQVSTPSLHGCAQKS